MQAASRAAELLKDEQVRAKIVEHGRTAAHEAQQWRRARKAVAETRPEGRASVLEPIAGRFGQGRLERRVDNLRRSTEEVARQRPDLDDALLTVRRRVDDLAISLRVAGGLPFAKRKRAHLKLDGILDDLENAVLEASMSTSSTAPDPHA